MSDNNRNFEDVEFVAEANDNKPEKKKSKITILIHNLICLTGCYLIRT